MRSTTATRAALLALSLALLAPGTFAASVGALPTNENVGNVFGLDDISSPGSMAERCREVSREGDRVWLSLCRDWQVDPDGHIRRWFDENLETLGRRSFAGVELRLYGKRGI